MKDITFILSTGRTGTNFFEDYITETFDKSICIHEPKPSRRFKIMSNKYLQKKISESIIVNQYLKVRKRLFKKYDGYTYVESSNFIFGCIPALNTKLEGIKVLHIVRDPHSYVVSHLNYGSWKGYKRLVSRYFPHWIEFSVTKELDKEPVKVFAKRWSVVNQTISDYKKTNDYLFVKFENLFSKDLSIASKTINEIRRFLGQQPLAEEENIKWLTVPKNTSNTKKVNTVLNSQQKQFIKDTCGDLMKEYDY